MIAGYDPREAARRVRAALDKVGLLHKENQNPIALSSGEQQRVGIARAVVNKPPLLLADEPTGNLDPELSAEIMELFEQFSSVGVTVLIASHDLTLISRLEHKNACTRSWLTAVAGIAMNRTPVQEGQGGSTSSARKVGASCSIAVYSASGSCSR